MANNSTSATGNVSNSDNGWCMYEQEIIYSLPSQILFSLLYLSIFLLGTAGNLLVSLAVARSKHMHSVTNLFIMNLALSDILMCCFSVPFTPLASFTGRWLFGRTLCKLFPFSQGVSVYISTLTLTVIAIDRFVVINYPFRARMQIKTCVVLIILIDLLACLFTAPYAFAVDIFDETEEPKCAESWSGWERTAYGAFTNVTQFVLPFTTIILCYSAIIRKLNERQSQRPGTLRNAKKAELERQRNVRTNRMLICMVVLFGTCWLPLNCINFIADLGVVPVHCWQYYHLVFFICHVLAMSSTCYNPFVYAWHNESFRREFVKMVPLLRGACDSCCTNVNATCPDNEDDNANVSRAGLTTMNNQVEVHYSEPAVRFSHERDHVIIEEQNGDEICGNA